MTECDRIQRVLEKVVGPHVQMETDSDYILLSAEDAGIDPNGVNCLAEIHGLNDNYSDAYFKKGVLVESDTVVKEGRGHLVVDIIREKAKSCALKDIHEHLGAEHVHLRGCTLGDFVKVLDELGY